MTTSQTGAYGAGDMLVDYILGITYEIWDERKIKLINQYYSVDTKVSVGSSANCMQRAMGVMRTYCVST